MPTTNVAQALKWGQKILDEQGIATAHLDCLVLLEDNSGVDRAKLVAEPQLIIEAHQINNFRRQIRQRSKHLPLAYIRQKTEFYGREFMINRHVLEPRPESETIIEELKKTKLSNYSVIDLGTGSGAIIISAKLELPHIKAYATDISSQCIAIAKKNAEHLKARVAFFEGNLTGALPNNIWQVDTVVLANLPYVPENWQINTAALSEPRIAIFGGRDGLDPYRQLFSELHSLDLKPRLVMTESLPPQHSKLTAIARKGGFKLDSTNDFISIFSPL